MIEDIKKDLKINQYDLDSELIRQPLLYERICSYLYNLENRRDKKKSEVDIVYSEIFIEIKETSKKKETEASIKAKIYTDDRYKKVKEEHLQLVYEASMAEGMKWAYDHRRTSLDSLIKLYLNNYYKTEDRISQQQVELLKQNQRLK